MAIKVKINVFLKKEHQRIYFVEMASIDSFQLLQNLKIQFKLKFMIKLPGIASFREINSCSLINLKFKN